MLMDQKKLCTYIILLLIPNIVSAIELTGMVGIANMQQNDATFDLTSNETDLLVQTDTQAWDAWSLQLGAGYVYPLFWEFNDEKSINDIQWFTAITPQINFYILNNSDLQGEVYRLEDIDDNDAAYTLNFESTRLMFDTALTIAKLRKLSLYGIAGLGVAWNDLGLAMTPYADTNLEPLNFNSGSSTGFAYEFGAGLTYELDEELGISLQYLYTGFNDVEISGQDDIFSVTNSDLKITSQSLLLGFNLSV